MIDLFDDLRKVNFKPDDVFLHFTGNIFGIGCAACSPEAMLRIASLKKREAGKGFIVLFSSFEQMRQYQIPALDDANVFSLLNQYLPGNLTAVLHTDDQRFKSLAIDNKIAVRIPTSKLLRDFIAKVDTPIVSTSVNIATEPPCNDLDILQNEYAHWFDYGIYNHKEIAEAPIPSTIIDIATGLSCLREGSIPFAEIEQSFAAPLIQFVCVGNICRSPMAEFYARQRFIDEGLPFRTASCGILQSGQIISDNSRIILRKNGITCGHRLSIQVNDDIVRQSMLLLCMSLDIKKRLVAMYPNATGKIYTIAEYTGHTADVDDPYGYEASYYEEAFELIKKYIESFIQMNNGKNNNE